MQKRKEVSHDNDNRLGVGGDDSFELSCSFCLIFNFWGKQVMNGRQTPTVSTPSIRQHSLLTGMLQELAGALSGKERLLQSSEVELQHSRNRIQVIHMLRQGILSYQANIEPGSKYWSGWSWLTQTHLPLSNASLMLLISIWEPGTRNIPSWWRPGGQMQF